MYAYICRRKEIKDVDIKGIYMYIRIVFIYSFISISFMYTYVYVYRWIHTHSLLYTGHWNLD